MARDPGKDMLKNPTPTAGTTKKTVDGVLTALKIGSSAVSLLAGLLAAVLILYSGYVLYDTFKTEYQAYSSSWDLLKYKPNAAKAQPTDEDSAEILQRITKDYRAWLSVYDSTIDYPVVQGKDDLYYASHDIYNETSLTGAIYLAAGNARDFSDSYNIIYGHHMDNGAMFGSLDKFKDPDYFQAHRAGILVTESGIYEVTFFAVVSTNAYEYQIYHPGDWAKGVIDFLLTDQGAEATTKNLIMDEKTARSATKVVALSTCADATTDGRLVILGKMVKRQGTGEETVKLKVHYLEGEKEALPADEYTYKSGDKYYIVAPQRPGYKADVEVLTDTITGDTDIYIRYTPETYKLKIQYIHLDGTSAGTTYTGTMKTGETRQVTSPVIEGYKALKLKISTTNKGRDEEYTVIYVPEDQYESIMTIEDYETATNLGTTHVQIGICLE